MEGFTPQNKQVKSSYSIDFKLSAITFAENNSNRKAGKHFGVDESIIRRWRKIKEDLLKIPNKSSKTVIKLRKPKWAALEVHLKSWILEQRKNGFQVSGSSALIEARKHANLMNLKDFKGSANWVYKFMKRNRIVRRAVTSIGQNLPDDWESKMNSFRKYVTENKQDLGLDQIGNMDEVPVTFDMPARFTLEEKGQSDVRVATTGSQMSRFTVALCVTADGAKLPAYVIFRRKTLPKGNFPSNIIISANDKSSMTSAEIQLWIDKVWKKRKNSFFDKKSLLMLDSAPGHKTNDVKAKFKREGTTIAMIPGGLTKKLQVLDISVNKSFKSNLRKYWESWMINGYKEYTKSGHMKRASYEEICEWISKAWIAVPLSAILNGFKKTTISFYDETCDELKNFDFDSDSEDDDMGIINEEEAAVREKLIDIFLDYQNSDEEDQFD